ncbi:MAG: cysteine desulfurase, partial [Planctomycetota bacterium]
EDARAQIARLLHVQPVEIIFTRGGTEANALPLVSVLRGISREFPDETPHVVASAIEHPAVYELLQDLATRGMIELSLVPVDARGVVDLRIMGDMITEKTRLVSIMYVNNELGTIQPIREIVKLVRRHRKDLHTPYPLIHTDAIQAAGYLDIHVPRLGVDMLSLSGSKIYGPRGLGCAYMRKGIPVESFMLGGNQEHGLRSGTEDVAGCVGLAEALELAMGQREREYGRMYDLQQIFLHGIHILQERFPNRIRLHGSFEHGERVPNNIHAGIQGISGERLVIELDAQYVAASARSACSTTEEGQSHVLTALYTTMQISEELVEYGMVRFSMGRETRGSDIEKAMQALGLIMEKIIQEKQLYDA